MPDVDLDFLVEKVQPEFYLPPGWEQHTGRFGNPKLIKGKLMIDFVPLATVYSIVKRNLPPTIENYLSGTPLTIQSIAYDLQEQQLLGEVGLQAIQERRVVVHNREMAEYAAKMKGKPLDDYIFEKALQLGFKAMAP
jgi:hypothetical protein